eukprot:460594-Pelagomonas_calceolata.AAC.4
MRLLMLQLSKVGACKCSDIQSSPSIPTFRYALARSGACNTCTSAFAITCTIPLSKKGILKGRTKLVYLHHPLCADEVLQERFQACMQVVGRVGCTDDDESQASHAKGKPRAAVHLSIQSIWQTGMLRATSTSTHAVIMTTARPPSPKASHMLRATSTCN